MATYVLRRLDVQLDAFSISKCVYPTGRNATSIMSSTPNCTRNSMYDIMYCVFIHHAWYGLITWIVQVTWSSVIVNSLNGLTDS